MLIKDYYITDDVKRATDNLPMSVKQELIIRVARFSTFFSDRLGTYGKSCVPMPIKEPYNLFDLG